MHIGEWSCDSVVLGELETGQGVNSTWMCVYVHGYMLWLACKSVCVCVCVCVCVFVCVDVGVGVGVCSLRSSIPVYVCATIYK